MSNCEEVTIPTLVPDRVQQCQLGSSMINLFSDYIHRLGRQFAIIIISTLQYSSCWINKTEPHLITFVRLLGSKLHLTINNEMFLLYTPTEEYFDKALARYFPQADSLHVFGLRIWRHIRYGESRHRLVWSGHPDSR
jgi:hypothetical protein